MYMVGVWGTKWQAIPRNALATCSLLLTLCMLAACSGVTNSEAKEDSVSLNKISWCNKQVTMVFVDDRAAITPGVPSQGTNPETPQSITGTLVAMKDWNTLKTSLGFKVFLPTELPSGSCLLSAAGSIHNPISGSNFTLTYLLPDQTSITIVQAPQDDKQTNFQCSALPNISSPTSHSTTQGGGTPGANVQLCTGTRETTNITFSANWNKQKLQQFFQDLQLNVNWIPRS